MARIELASERFDLRKSTSVAGRGSSSQRSRPARTLYDHPLVFRAGSGIVRGTHTFVSPNPSPGGERGRWTRGAWRHGCYVDRLCSEGHSSVVSAVGT